MRAGKRRNRPVVNTTEALAARLPAELLAGHVYDVLDAIGDWLARNGLDPWLRHGVLRHTGYDFADGFKRWLEEP